MLKFQCIYNRDKSFVTLAGVRKELIVTNFDCKDVALTYKGIDFLFFSNCFIR